MNDMVDITPKGIDQKGTGQSNIKMAVFQETEIEHILENPSGLTKEGIKEKVNIWKNSNNGQCKAKYNTMLVKCQKVQPSGTFKETLKTGEEVQYLILARDKTGNVTWKKRDLSYVPKKAEKEKVEQTLNKK